MTCHVRKKSDVSTELRRRERKRTRHRFSCTTRCRPDLQRAKTPRKPGWAEGRFFPTRFMGPTMGPWASPLAAGRSHRRTSCGRRAAVERRVMLMMCSYLCVVFHWRPRGLAAAIVVLSAGHRSRTEIRRDGRRASTNCFASAAVR